MRIVFIGASRFGLKCLETLSGIRQCQIVGVVTAPQRFKISYSREGVKNFLHADLAEFAHTRSIPSVCIEGGMKDRSLFEKVRNQKPDCFIVVGWYHMVPKSWRDLAPAYGMHASLLPRYSGGAPLVWAMIKGEEKTGITLFRFGSGVDSGPILDQAETPIQFGDDIGTLYARIESLGLELLRNNIPKLVNGTARFRSQDESLRTTFPQRSPADGLLSWRGTRFEVYNFVRAQTRPYPGAFFEFLGTRIKVWRCAIGPGDRVDSDGIGLAKAVDEGLLVNVLDGKILIREAEINGKVIRDKALSDMFSHEKELDLKALK